MSPASIRTVVVLPAPFGPEQAEDLAVPDRERQVVDGRQGPERACRGRSASIIGPGAQPDHCPHPSRIPFCGHDPIGVATLDAGRANHRTARVRGPARDRGAGGRGRASDGHRTTREIVEHPGAVAILAWDGERLAMVRQWRHATGQVLLEIPAGTLEPGEPPDETARRELAEEVGLAAATLGRGAALLHRTRLLHRAHAPLPGDRPDATPPPRPTPDEVLEPSLADAARRRWPRSTTAASSMPSRWSASAGWPAASAAERRAGTPVAHGALEMTLEIDDPERVRRGGRAALRHRRDARHPPPARRHGVHATSAPMARRIADPGSHRMDPRAGHPAGLDRRLDLPDPARPHPGRPAATRAGASSTATTRAGATVRDETKYERMIEFARALPRIRARVPSATCAGAACRARRCSRRSSGCSRRRSSASATTSTRARTARFGLTTLRDRHVERRRRRRCASRSAARAARSTTIDARATAAWRGSSGAARSCPGQELFQYVDDDGERAATSTPAT